MGHLGIDFGTCAVRGVYRDSGDESPVRTRTGAYELPSAVSISDAALRVGRVALERALMHPGQTATNVRAFLRAGHSAPMPEGVSSGVALASLLLGEMKDLARIAGAGADAKVLVGLPAGWNSTEAARMKEACSAAGFGEASVVPEPLCLAENVVRGDGGIHHHCFLDLGGSSVSCAVVRESGNALSLLSWVVVPYGGEDVDRRISEVILGQLGLDAAPTGFEEMVRVACESLKRDLGEAQTSSYRLPCVLPGGPPDAAVLQLDRTALSEALNQYLEVTSRCLRTAMTESGLPAADQPPVHLVGKMSVIREVKEMVQGARPDGEVLLLSPGEGVATGAARILENERNWRGADAIVLPVHPPQEVQSITPADGAASEKEFSRPIIQDPFAESAVSERETEVIRAEDVRDAMVPANPLPSDLGVMREPISSAPPPMAPRVMQIQWTPSEGSLRSPASPVEVLGLPLLRAPEPHELEPIAGPVLLRMLSRPDIAGTLHIETGSTAMSLTLKGGYGYASSKEFSGFARTLMRENATYQFVSGFPESAYTRKRQSLVRIMVEGLRILTRAFEPDETYAALGDRVHRVPVIRKGKERLLRRLGLMSAEQRFVEYSLDGVRPVSELILNCGIGKNRGMQLLLILTACDVLEYKAAEYHEVSLAQLLDERAISIRHKNHFEVLSLHWSVLPDEIDVAYRKLRAEVAPGSEAGDENPSAAKEIRERIEEAYDVLSDARLRAAYRVEAYPNVDYRMIDDFLEQQRKAVALHDEKAAKRVRESQLEIKESQALQGRGREKSEFDE